MTLRQLLKSGIIKENIVIAESYDTRHLCDAGTTCLDCSCPNCRPLINIVRNYGPVTIDKIIQSGGEKYLDSKVTDIFGYTANKLAILIHLKPELKASFIAIDAKDYNIVFDIFVNGLGLDKSIFESNSLIRLPQNDTKTISRMMIKLHETKINFEMK